MTTYPFLENLGGEAWGGEADAYIYRYMTAVQLTKVDSSLSTWDLQLHVFYVENEVQAGLPRDLEWHGKLVLTSTDYTTQSSYPMSMGLVYKQEGDNFWDILRVDWNFDSSTPESSSYSGVDAYSYQWLEMEFQSDNTNEPSRFRVDPINNWTVDVNQSGSSCSSEPLVCVHTAHYMKKFDTADTFDKIIHADGPFWWLSYVWFHIEDTDENLNYTFQSDIYNITLQATHMIAAAPLLLFSMFFY